MVVKVVEEEVVVKVVEKEVVVKVGGGRGVEKIVEY